MDKYQGGYQHVFSLDELYTWGKDVRTIPMILSNSEVLKRFNTESQILTSEIFNQNILNKNITEFTKLAVQGSEASALALQKMKEYISNGILVYRGMPTKQIPIVLEVSSGDHLMGIRVNDNFNLSLRVNEASNKELILDYNELLSLLDQSETSKKIFETKYPGENIEFLIYEKSKAIMTIAYDKMVEMHNTSNSMLKAGIAIYQSTLDIQGKTHFTKQEYLDYLNVLSRPGIIANKRLRLTPSSNMTASQNNEVEKKSNHSTGKSGTLGALGSAKFLTGDSEMKNGQIGELIPNLATSVSQNPVGKVGIRLGKETLHIATAKIASDLIIKLCTSKDKNLKISDYLASMDDEYVNNGLFALGGGSVNTAIDYRTQRLTQIKVVNSLYKANFADKIILNPRQQTMIKHQLGFFVGSLMIALKDAHKTPDMTVGDLLTNVAVGQVQFMAVQMGLQATSVAVAELITNSRRLEKIKQAKNLARGLRAASVGSGVPGSIYLWRTLPSLKALLCQ